MNLDKINAKLASLTEKPGSGKKKNEHEDSKWKPGIGKHLVRVVPSKFDPEDPFKEVFVHYQFGNKTIISPINFGEKDPIVEFSKQLRKSKDPEDWKLAKKIEPKMRVFVPVIVRGEEEKGVRMWEFAKQVYTELLGYIGDEEIGDVTDVLSGRDIKVTVTEGAQYKETATLPAMKTSPLSSDESEITKWLENQPNPIDFYKKYTFDEIKDALQDWLNPEEDEPIVEAEEKPFVEDAKTKVTSNKTSVKPKESLEESEFDNLFKED